MSVAEALDTIRTEMPGCVLAAFGDLKTKLILRASSRETWPQEELDKIGAQAVRAFGLADRLAASHGGPAGNDLIVLTSDDTRVIGRSAVNDADFLCCICSDGTRPDHIAASVRAQLDLLDEGA